MNRGKTRDTLGNTSEFERSQPRRTHNTPWTSPPRPTQWQTSLLAAGSPGNIVSAFENVLGYKTTMKGRKLFILSKNHKISFGKSCTFYLCIWSLGDKGGTWNSSNYTSNHYLYFFCFSSVLDKEMKGSQSHITDSLHQNNPTINSWHAVRVFLKRLFWRGGYLKLQTDTQP